MLENTHIIEFTRQWFISFGNAGNLNMRNDRHKLFKTYHNIAMNDLAVIDVILEFQVRQGELRNEVGGKIKIIEEVAWHIARVYRLNHNVNPKRCCRSAGELKR